MFNWKFRSIYSCLVILRFILVFIPQFGYIHPDEYFQSIEILAGRTFEVEYNPPWEFNTTMPIRSMAIPYFTIGISYKILILINYLVKNYINIITPYTLLVIPRLVMCLLSFLVDLSIYKLCKCNNEKYKSKLIILASSYVMIVYGTRTFSNTIELVLFAILLYYVTESLIFSNILIKKYEYLNYRYMKSENLVEKVKFHKLKLYLTTDLLRNCFPISTVTVLGFFNRPTFLAFALFPVFFWLYRGIGSKVVLPLNYHVRILVFILYCIPSIVLLVLIDSFFYYFISWGEIGMLNISINNFVFTPLNFFKYNIDSKNLAKHGLHPKFLHLLVNTPLLFNILGIFGFISLLQDGNKLLRQQYHLLPSVRSIKGLMTLSLIAPITLLSLFPHQEPRFLIPLIIPLVYLHSSTILLEKHNVLIKPKTKEQIVIENLKKTRSTIYLKFWLIANIILTIFYGFIHQGGVYQATNYLTKDLQTKSQLTKFHIFTSHIYSIPESFLLQKLPTNSWSINNKEITINKRVTLYEEGSKDLKFICKQIELILKLNKETKQKQIVTYLIIPNMVEDQINDCRNLKFTAIDKFYSHVSIEAIYGLIDKIAVLNFFDDYYNLFGAIFSSFGLRIYQITLL